MATKKRKRRQPIDGKGAVVVGPPLRPRVMDIKAACLYASIGRTKMYSLISARKIAARKFGARTLVEVDSIEAFLRTLPEL